MSNFQVEYPSHTFKIEMTFWIDLVEDGVKYRMKSVRFSDFLTDLTHTSIHFNASISPFIHPKKYFYPEMLNMHEIYLQDFYGVYMIC